MNPRTELKESVRAHWERTPCGTRDIPPEERKAFFDELERERYSLEPYIKEFARFSQGAGQRLLEVGVGAGTDFVNWVRNGAIATGVDLTEAGVALTKERLALEGLHADVHVADAEKLPFQNDSFDIVYSYGVIHHSPDTQRAVDEVWRVLKPGGKALVMIYRVPSWTALMVWGIHCAAQLRPWHSLKWAVYHHLESPGTKTYTFKEARALFSRFSQATFRSQLSHGDLLLMRPSERYSGLLNRVLWRFYPRWLVRSSGNQLGLGLLIEAHK